MMVRVQTGVATATRKLYSHKGTLLGTITYPAGWERRLRDPNRGHIRLTVARELRLSDYLRETEGFEKYFTFVLRRHYGRSYGVESEGVELHGLTLEEFEQQPGCSFAPGAGYLRSILE